jgi:CTD small phosphatase-like protein 2
MNALEFLSTNYELCIFTAGDKAYADAILDRIDPNKEYIAHRLYRQHCTKRGNFYVKDLRIIEDRDLKDIILVDNSIISFAFQMNNGVPISSFHGL